MLAAAVGMEISSDSGLRSLDKTVLCPSLCYQSSQTVRERQETIETSAYAKLNALTKPYRSVFKKL